MNNLSVSQIIEMLEMKPHPEGGYYSETFRDEEDGVTRSTAIYYLLESGRPSHWHRVHGSSEIWHHYAGEPVSLTISSNGHDTESHRLGKTLQFGERPQVVVPSGWWQSAECVGKWALVGCTVAPGFEFENFELAEEDWQPSPRRSAHRQNA